MTTEECCLLMKPHKPLPISCLTCRSLGQASQRSAMAILRCGLMGGIIIVMATASQGHPRTAPPSHTCPAHSLEQNLAVLEGDWLLRIHLEGDWLVKALEASLPPCPFHRLLLLIFQRSPAPFRCQVKCRMCSSQVRGPNSSWTMVKVRVRALLSTLTCIRKSTGRGFASVGSVGKASALQQI